MINQRNGKVYGYHRRKAASAGTLWRIHWNADHDNLVSVAMPTDAAYTIARGYSDVIVFMENMDLKVHIDKIIYAMKHGVTCGDGAGLFFSYISDDKYHIVDPATDKVEDDYMETGEKDIRRRLQIYYTKKPDELDEDMLYIEETLRELA
jgi:hypothetical protein